MLKLKTCKLYSIIALINKYLAYLGTNIKIIC